MKRQFLVLAALTMVVFSLQAQPQRGQGRGGQMMAQIEELQDMDPQARAEELTQKLTKKLDLSEDQANQVEELYTAQGSELQQIAKTYQPTIDAMRDEIQAAREENVGDREAMRASMQEIREKYQEDTDKLQEEMKAVRIDTDEKMQEILSDEQYATYDQMKEERQDNRQDRKKSRRPGGGRRPN